MPIQRYGQRSHTGTLRGALSPGRLLIHRHETNNGVAAPLNGGAAPGKFLWFRTDPTLKGPQGRAAPAARGLTIAFTLLTRRGIDIRQIARLQGFGDAPTHISFEKRMDRTRARLTKQGLKVWFDYGTGGDTGEYRIKVGQLPLPPDKGQITTLTRWLNILLVGERGWPATLDELATFLRVKEETILKDLEGISQCGTGPAPHELLDARIDETTGLLQVSGPTIWIKRRSR